jgi:hypothetical protein
MAKAFSSLIRRLTYWACAAAAFVSAAGAAATTGGGLLAGASTGWFEAAAAGETFPLSADEDVDCGWRAFDIRTMTPNKPAASSSMATTTFGLILQGSQDFLKYRKKHGSIRADPVSNQFLKHFS